MHRQPGRWLLAWSKEQGWSLLPQDAFPEPHTALGLVPGAAQQENHLSLPGDRRGARPCLPWPSTAPARELVPAESGRKERRTVACTFNDFNCQVFSASGWKIVIRAPHTGVSPAGSTLALVSTGAALPGDMGTCRVAGAPRSHPHWGRGTPQLPANSPSSPQTLPLGPKGTAAGPPAPRLEADAPRPAPSSPLLQCRTQSWKTAPHFSCSLPVITQK